MEERKSRHAHQSPQKKHSADRRHPGGPGHHALPVLHAPLHPEESLEFYTPDGNGVGSFRVEITDMPSNPAYTEVKIIPEDMEPFQRFMSKFRNKPVTAKIPSYGSHIVVPGRDMQCDGVLRLAGH